MSGVQTDSLYAGHLHKRAGTSMVSLKSLVKDTAIYGLSSIIGRFLNYLLVPLYTYVINSSSGDYGVVTNLYAYTAILLVLLTYGMETTFFRYANKSGEDPGKVFSTILTSVLVTSAAFVALVVIFIDPVSSALGYAGHPSYIWAMAATVAIDAFQCIPFTYLRHKKRPVKFASLKLLFIFLNIFLNLCYFVILPKFGLNPAGIYDNGFEVGFVFYINLFCTALITFFFWNELKEIRHGFDWSLMKRMLSYSWPILVLGIAGILNQSGSQIIFPFVYGEGSDVPLGIYGACIKIAMIMAMITQAFRYAYEPFVFGNAKEKDSKEAYAKAMKYFIIFTLLAFLCVIGSMNILQFIIGADYREGLKIVPVVMAAEIMMGIYFNLSFWYKLIDQTLWGALFSGIGCAVLFAVDIIFIPEHSYMACAWAGVAAYGTAMVLSYFVGQKKNRIDYPLKDIFIYVLIAGVLFAGMSLANRHLGFWSAIGANAALILVFCAVIVKRDIILSELPLVGKYFKS